MVCNFLIVAYSNFTVQRNNAYVDSLTVLLYGLDFTDDCHPVITSIFAVIVVSSRVTSSGVSFLIPSLRFPYLILVSMMSVLKRVSVFRGLSVSQDFSLSVRLLL